MKETKNVCLGTLCIGSGLSHIEEGNKKSAFGPINGEVGQNIERSCKNWNRLTGKIMNPTELTNSSQESIHLNHLSQSHH